MIIVIYNYKLQDKSEQEVLQTGSHLQNVTLLSWNSTPEVVY